MAYIEKLVIALPKYYDSFGNLSPPFKLQKYFIECDFKYNNYVRHQNEKLRALVFKVFIVYTITLNGNSGELSCDIFPPIELDKTSQINLLSLQTILHQT